MTEVRDWHKDMELCERYAEEKWAALPDGSLYNRRGNQLTTYWDSCRESAINEYRQALPHWLQQYAAEKERADNLQEDLTDLEHRYLHLEEHSLKQKFKLEEEKQRADIAELAYQGLADDGVSRGEYESLLDKHSSMTKAYRAAEAREKKLREAIKEAIDTWESLDVFDDPLDAVEKMIAILQPFYPDKEEEAK